MIGVERIGTVADVDVLCLDDVQQRPVAVRVGPAFRRDEVRVMIGPADPVPNYGIQLTIAQAEEMLRELGAAIAVARSRQDEIDRRVDALS